MHMDCHFVDHQDLCGMLHSFHQHDICLGTLEITTDIAYTSKEDVEALDYGTNIIFTDHGGFWITPLIEMDI